jgi:hypothetical protein
MNTPTSIMGLIGMLWCLWELHKMEEAKCVPVRDARLPWMTLLLIAVARIVQEITVYGWWR